MNGNDKQPAQPATTTVAAVDVATLRALADRWATDRSYTGSPVDDIRALIEKPTMSTPAAPGIVPIHFVNLMDILRDEYAEVNWDTSAPLNSVRDSLISALNAYADVRAALTYTPSPMAAPGIDLEQFRELHKQLVSEAGISELNELEADSIGLKEAADRAALRSKILFDIAARLGALIDASPKGGNDEANIPAPHRECYSDDGGDSWYEHPAYAELVYELKVGDTYTLIVSHYPVERTYRVTKAPDEASDDYEVEPVQPTSHGAGVSGE